MEKGWAHTSDKFIFSKLKRQKPCAVFNIRLVLKFYGTLPQTDITYILRNLSNYLLFSIFSYIVAEMCTYNNVTLCTFVI